MGGGHVAVVLRLLDGQILGGLFEHRPGFDDEDFLGRLLVRQRGCVEFADHFPGTDGGPFRDDRDDVRRAFDFARQDGILHAVERAAFGHGDFERTDLAGVRDQTDGLILLGQQARLDLRPAGHATNEDSDQQQQQDDPPCPRRFVPAEFATRERVGRRRLRSLRRWGIVGG